MRDYIAFQPMAVPLLMAIILCIHLRIMKKPFKIFAVVIIAVILFINTTMFCFRVAKFMLG